MKYFDILIVEDDPNLAQLIEYNLSNAGFVCLKAEQGESVLPLLESSPIDLIILDIMLPGINGFEVCKRVRADSRYSAIPIIMLTAKSEEIDRVLGFELGADDYVVKPFSPRELVLRVKSQLKHSKITLKIPALSGPLIAMPGVTIDKSILVSGELTVDIPRHKVMVNQKEVSLTALEFKLLVTLMERAGRVQSRQQLLNDVWDIAVEVTTRTVDTHIKRLRQQLGSAGAMIETVRGVGYRVKE